VADVAINPIESGSGTNLKMLEYAAAGVPILPPPHGARGLSFRDGEHLRIAALADWPAALEAMRAERGSAAGRERCEAARAWVEAHYAWDGIAERLLGVLPLTDRR
jgi:glycosyltransferase involved in cell wall biosynthesis